LYARDDANRSKRYAFCEYQYEEWRTRSANNRIAETGCRPP